MVSSSLIRRGFYYARVPTEQGQLYELRGWEPLPAEDLVSVWANNFLDHPPGAERIRND